MPTISAGASAAIALVQGTRIKVSSGSGIAVLGPGPQSGQQYALSLNGAVGPFDRSQTVYLTALTALDYLLELQDQSVDLTDVAAASAQAFFAGSSNAVVIYGATPGGIAAAIAAARLNRKVILLSESDRIGGMQGWGITQTDVDVATTPFTLTGFPREFYSYVGRRESNATKTWQRYHRVSAPGRPSWFTRAFNEFVARESNITVVRNFTDIRVNKIGARITSVASGTNVITGGAFIDASYCGDLAAAAGCTTAIGRESTALYSEALAGILSPAIPSSWGGASISPYVISGNSGSGLLPGVEATPGTVGAGDGKVMTWNYRLFVTTNAGDRVAFPTPDLTRYTTAVAAGAYELLARAMQASSGTLDTMAEVFQLYTNSLVSGCFDLNGRPGVTTNYLNNAELVEYITATESRRAVIRENVKQWVLGLLYWIRFSGDARIPAGLVTDIANYGLSATELQATGGFSPELYVREGRRIVGDYVMTQANVTLANGYTDEIGYLMYGFDTPQVRLVNDAGVTKQDGSQLTALTSSQLGARIPYRVLLPKASEATNLLCVGCPSVSQVVWRTTRLEPTLMQIGQAAGIAAALALDGAINVQSVDTARLKKIQDLQEVADGIVLCTDTGFSSEGTITYTGSWADDATRFGAIGPTGTGKKNGGVTTKVAKFQPLIRETGAYEAFLYYVPQAQGSGPTAVPVVVSHADGTANRTVNMEYPGGAGGRESLGIFTFRTKIGGAVSDDYVEVQCTGVSGNVVVSAVKWVKVG